jgi:hypothetical protein
MNKHLIALSNYLIKLSIHSERQGNDLMMRLSYMASELVLDLKHELVSR